MIRTDYSPDSLVDALRGQDAVVSCVGPTALGGQLAMVDAAAKAGVKRFLPSEMGSNTADHKLLDPLPALAVKTDVVNRLKEKEREGLSWTVLINGPFYDWVCSGSCVEVILASSISFPGTKTRL